MKSELLPAAPAKDVRVFLQCDAPVDELEARATRTTKCFLQAAVALEFSVTVDGRVGEEEAAKLLGYATGSLRNMRSAGVGPSYFDRPLAGSAKSYRLEDLALWLERSRQKTI